MTQRTPPLMRAVLLRGHGGFEQLEYRDDLPVPAAAAGEVLIRISAAAVNNTDINTRVGWYSKSRSAEPERMEPPDGAWTGSAVHFPRIQGADACGRIVAVGAGVDASRVGERVLVNPVLTDIDGGPPEYFGSDRDGAFAEFCTVPAANACTLTSSLTDAELASFPCAYGAAENMLTRAGVVAGETVLITGASGGVGSAAVQLARRRGARVVAISSAAQAAAISSLGAERVLARETGGVSELGRESVDVVIDVVGGPLFPQLLAILRRAGRYAVAGAVAGAVVELDLRTLYLRDLRLLGCTLFEPQVFGNIIGYIERGEILPLVSATYPLAAIARAQREFLAHRLPGKIVLTVP